MGIARVPKDLSIQSSGISGTWQYKFGEDSREKYSSTNCRCVQFMTEIAWANDSGLISDFCNELLDPEKCLQSTRTFKFIKKNCLNILSVMRGGSSNMNKTQEDSNQ